MCLQAVAALYRQPALAGVTHLQDNLEDLFDVGVAPYFPVLFKPPKDNPEAITGDKLLQAVIAAMASCPQFAALAIPLLSEKLGSALRWGSWRWFYIASHTVRASGSQCSKQPMVRQPVHTWL